MKKKIQPDKLEKLEFLVACGVGLAAVATAGVCALLKLRSKRQQVENKEYLRIDIENSSPAPQEGDPIPSAPEFTDEDLPEITPQAPKLSFEEAYKIATDVAKEQFGENGFIVPASEKKASEVNIHGSKRYCYMFGADKMDLVDGSMKGLYHVDANTGEVFDNGQGDMKQIRFV